MADLTRLESLIEQVETLRRQSQQLDTVMKQIATGSPLSLNGITIDQEMKYKAEIALRQRDALGDQEVNLQQRLVDLYRQQRVLGELQEKLKTEEERRIASEAKASLIFNAFKQEKEKETELLKQELLRAHSVCKTLDDDSKKHQLALQELQMKLDQTEAANQSLQQREYALLAKASEHRGVEAQLADLRGQLDTKTLQHGHQQTRIESLEKHRAQLTQDIDQYLARDTALRQSLAESQKATDVHRQRAEGFEQALAREQAQGSAVQCKALETRVLQLSQSLELERSKCAEAEQQLAKERAQAADLARASQTFQAQVLSLSRMDLKQLAPDFFERLKLMEETLQQTKDKYSSLRQRLGACAVVAKHQEERFEALKATLDVTKAELLATTRAAATSAQEVSDRDATLTSYQGRLDDLESAHRSLNGDLQEAEASLADSNRAKLKLGKQCKELKLQVNDYEERLSASQNSAKLRSAELAATSDQRSGALQSQLEKQLSELTLELQQRTQQLSTANQICKDQDALLVRLRTNADDQDRKLAIVSQHSHLLEIKLSTAVLAGEDYKRQLEELSASHMEMEKRLAEPPFQPVKEEITEADGQPAPQPLDALSLDDERSRTEKAKLKRPAPRTKTRSKRKTVRVKEEPMEATIAPEPKTTKPVNRATPLGTQVAEIWVAHIPKPTSAPPNSPERVSVRRNVRRGTVAIEWIELV